MTERSSRGPAEPLRVLYIAGSGRCGSTLLARVIGEIPGYVNVGELVREVPPQSERCGCGRAFADCPFWAAVGKRAFGGWDTEYLKSISQLQARVTRQRYRRRLTAVEQAGRADWAKLGACYESLYRAVTAESGAAYVVDKSGDVLQALVLAEAGLDVRVIQLIRDARGVAFSMSRRHAWSPDAANRRDDFTWRASPATAAALWAGNLREAKLLPQRGIPVVALRYEDFVRKPAEAVAGVLDRLGLPVSPSGLAHIGDRRVVLPLGHGLAGNPSRFRQGELILAEDEVWRDQMSRRDRLIVTMIALPYLRRYYGRRHRALTAGTR